MGEFLSKLFDTEGFPPRWNCGTGWTEAHGWLHIVSDIATFAAYVAIPCVLVYFMRKRPDLPYPKVFWLFCAFIFSCGTVHLIEATLFWQPWYRFSGALKLVTAVVSCITVFALVRVVPRALALPGLAVAKARLEEEVQVRRETEERLRTQTDLLKRQRDELEAFNKAVMGREDRVLKLKEEVNKLLEELARPPRYSTS